MKKVCIVTAFRGYDPAYGLCRFVENEVKMLVRGGYTPRLIVRTGYKADECADAYAGAEIVAIDPGETGSNRVEVKPESRGEIDALEIQLLQAVEDFDVCITHDLIFQANLWKHHVAARRIAPKLPGLRWLHVVHSASALNTVSKTGRFRRELEGKFPNSRLVIFDREATNRYGALYGYEMDERVVIPPPVDFLADFHLLAQGIVLENALMRADIILTYPCRLDRGKQPHILIEIAEHLNNMGYDAPVVLIDSYSNLGDKLAYKLEMQEKAAEANVPLICVSDHPDVKVRLPHQAVMDLLEVADVMVQPSTTESYSRVMVEAAWKRCALVLNFDLPIFRQYDGLALFGKFSSTVDVLTGHPGSTKTEYSDRSAYMRGMAAAIAYQMENNPVLKLHRQMRQERSLEGVWPAFWAAIEGRQ